MYDDEDLSVDCYSLAEMAAMFGMTEGQVAFRAGRGALPSHIIDRQGNKWFDSLYIDRWLSPDNGLSKAGYKTYLRPEPDTWKNARAASVLKMNIELYLRAQHVRRQAALKSSAQVAEKDDGASEGT